MPNSQLFFQQPASDQHLELLSLSTFPDLPSGYEQGPNLMMTVLQALRFCACINLKLNAPNPSAFWVGVGGGYWTNF